MFPFRNGSLPANALLIAIGAAAGAGVTVLVAPLARDHQAGNEVSARGSTYASRSADSARKGKSGATIQNAMGIQDPTERSASLRAAGAEAAKRDPAHALSLCASLSSDQDKLDFLRGIYASWSLADPVAALDYAKSSMPAGLARTESIGIAVNIWAAKDPRAAWMWSEENLTGPLKEQAQTDVMIGWTRKSPETASNWLVSSGYTSQSLVGAVARTYAEQNPQAAFDWAKSLRDSTARRTAIDTSAREWISQNPAEAVPAIIAAVSKPTGADPAKDLAGNDPSKANDWLNSVSEGDGRDLPLIIPDVWGTMDPAATSDWINTLPAGAAKNEAAATLATVWAASDIDAAVKWSVSLADEAMRKEVITHIGTTWGAIEPDRALAWLNTLPAAVAADGITGAFNSWAATDAQGLRDWVDASPPAPEMDQARLSLADVLAASDIGSSLDLAFQLSSETARDQAVARYFRHWRKTDDASALQWLNQNWSTLQPSTRQRLTAEQQRRVVSR